jgi:ferritin-like metal-binding protein YciE
MKIRNLRELFEIELYYAYDCEQKLVKKGLPSMIDAATAPDLNTALEQHLEETRGQVRRLEQVFTEAGLTPNSKGNDILDKMMDAAKDSKDHIEASALRDAALIISGNGVEHYEMALYGSLVALAKEMRLEGAVRLLESTLAEEKAADSKRTEIAETTINPRAAQAGRAAGV